MALLAIKPPYTMRERWEAVYRYWRTWQRCLQPGQTPEQMAADMLRMTFQAAFPRILRPAFGPGLAAAAAAAGWWVVAGKTCVAAYQPIGAASLAASYTNLANPGTYDAAPGVAPTWDATNGWKLSSASSQWLETGITPVNDQTWSALVRFSNYTGGSTDGTGCFFGLIEGPRFAITQAVLSTHVYQSGSYRIIVSSNLVAGNYAIAGNQGYKNGISDGATIPSGGGAFTGTIAIGQTKEAGYNYYLDGYIQAVAIYSDTLTAGQVATLSAAMAALTG